MTSHEDEFSYPRTNLIVSSGGFTVEVKPPAGIRYTEADRHMHLFAEILTRSESTMVVLRSDVKAWDSPHDSIEVSDADRSRILDNIQRAFDFRGWVLEVED